MRDIFFLTIEYAGIPIGLLIFTILSNKLSSSNPISEEQKKESIWDRGIETMQIICVSTLLFGISFLGHSDGKELSSNKLVILCIAEGLTLLEVVAIMFMLLQLRTWGEKSREAKIYTNIVAIIFWALLISLIIFSYPYAHLEANSASSSVVETMHPNGQIEHHSNSVSLFSRKQVLVTAVFSLIILVSLIVWFTRHIIKARRKKLLNNYAKAIVLAGNSDTSIVIDKLKNSLKRTPSDSALIIDIHMKLAKIYQALGEEDKAIAEISQAMSTDAYRSFSYLRDGVARYLFNIYINRKNYVEAELLIADVSSETTASKLKVDLFNHIQKNKKN